MRQPSSSSSAGAAAKAGGSGTTASKTPCCSKVGLKRGPWTPEEDELLANYINKEGEGRWRTLPKRAGLLRCGKSCRLRWMNYLRPSVKRGQIAPDEEDLILRLHRLLGNRWSLIAGRIPGRTDNEIKNYWNTHLSKKLISQGIDPRTHKPLASTIPSADHDKPPSTSKPNFHTANPNLKVASSANLEDPSLPQYHDWAVSNANVNLQTSDVSGTGLKSSNDQDNEDDDINYCTDDVFSSFLNSLINEDVFIHNQNQIQLQINGIAIPAGSDPLISPQTTFAFGAGWDAPIMSSGSAFNQSDPKRFNEQVENKF